MKKALQRIINKDFKTINSLKNNNIYIEFDENNFLVAYAIIIGPKDSLYNNSILYFCIRRNFSWIFNKFFQIFIIFRIKKSIIMRYIFNFI